MNKQHYAALALAAGLAMSGHAMAQTAATTAAAAAPAAAAVPPAMLITAPAAEAPAAPVFNPHGLPLKVGTYKCELNRDVQIRSLTEDQQTAVIHWNKKDYTLKSVTALSGALRFEDLQSGLVWLVVVGKSMLLDIKAGKQLANECRT